MAYNSFGAFIEVESSISNGKREEHAAPVAPQKALPRIYHSVPQSPNDVELENIQKGKRQNGPSGSGTSTPISYPTPRALDVESRPASPVHEVDALQSFANPPMNRFRLLSACLMNFGNGLNDSAPGALVPYLETYVLFILAPFHRMLIRVDIMTLVMPLCL
jgi:hypothetical protein